MLLSVCMIVKNEEKVLGRCLDSLQGLADEIIVVDTGSNDGTKDIAKQYTDKIYDFEWINDFGAARNEALRHASGKWILVIDADEYVDPDSKNQFRARLRKTNPKKPFCFLVKIMNFTGAHGEQILESTGARLFINKFGIRYREAIHEQIESPRGEIEYELVSFTLFHSGYLPETVKEKNKTKRNLEILLRLESEEKLKDPYYCFVVGNEYSNIGAQQKAYDFYQKAVGNKKAEDAVYYVHLLDRFCQTALKLGYYRDAYEYILRGKKLWPNYSDYYSIEGILYHSLGFCKRATALFQQSLDIAERSQTQGRNYWITHEYYGKSVPHLSLAKIAQDRNDLHQLVYHLTAALKLDHNDFASLKTLLRTLAAHESTESIIGFIEKLYPRSNPKDAFIVFQTSLSEGLSGLAAHYRKACDSHSIPISYTDMLAYALLARESLPVSGEKDGELSPQLALFASVVSKDERYLSQAGSAGEDLTGLYLRLAALENADGQQEAALAEGEHSTVAQLLAQLLQFGYDSEYDRILQRCMDVPLLESLVGLVDELGYRDLAMNMYAVLLDNTQLSGKNCRRMGYYCFIQGKPEEGLRLMEQALQSGPTFDMIGIVMENCEGLDISGFLSAYMEWAEEKGNRLPDFVKNYVGSV